MTVKVSKQEYAVVLFLITTIVPTAILYMYSGVPFLYSLLPSLFIALFTTMIYWYK